MRSISIVEQESDHYRGDHDLSEFRKDVRLSPPDLGAYDHEVDQQRQSPRSNDVDRMEVVHQRNDGPGKNTE